MPQFLADIALPVPVDRTFTYLVPPELRSAATVGSRVLVPFGTKTLTGVIIRLPSSSSVKGLKPIRDVLDVQPTFSGELIKLTQWIADYYMVPLGEVLRAAMPHGTVRESKRFVALIPASLDEALQSTRGKAPLQHKILLQLQKREKLTVAQLVTSMGRTGIHSALSGLSERGWITLTEELQSAAAKPKLEQFVLLQQYAGDGGEEAFSTKQRAALDALIAACDPTKGPIHLREFLASSQTSLAVVKTLERKMRVSIIKQPVVRTPMESGSEPIKDFALNEHQQSALGEVRSALEANSFRAFLLHGITGSGKTQVYIDAIRRALEQGKTAIVLVPEISLTPQTVRRFRAHFGNAIAVMHSAMSAGERHDAWQLTRDQKIKIVIGPRSAIFAPLENLGLIVVDEEHESSYKQFDAVPRYNARDVAVVRARNANAVVVLGSATPSIESYFNAREGKYRLLELPQRVDTAQLPRIDIVDMLKERKAQYESIKASVKESKTPFPKRLPDRSVSKLLQEQIAERIVKKEGTILLQNRRGFSHVMECFNCGHVERCDNCEVSLTYHATRKHLRCHYCGLVKKPPVECPECKSTEIRLHAFGTQQVEEELERLFPDATILRMDRDTTTKKGAHHSILSRFGSNEAQILLGTQMVAKGLDFPHVTLAGVISADTQMLLPDFRASERTFQLLTQVSGRSGRSNLAGEVVIQTLQPQHYSLKHVVAHDFQGFYREELAYRKELDYPPFSRIVLLEFSGLREDEVLHHARTFVELLAQRNPEKKFKVLGPADAAIAKINNRYRKHVIIKDLKSTDPTGAALKSALMASRQQYEASALGKNRAVSLTVDVDPQGMM